MPGSYSGHGEDLICIALLLDYPAITTSRLSQFDLKDISRSVPFLVHDRPMFTLDGTIFGHALLSG